MDANQNRPTIHPLEPVRDHPRDWIRPDRKEVITPYGSGFVVERSPGVSEEWVVGSHNRARNLSTGFITIDPSMQTSGHRHHVAESLTVLTGKISVEIEGRAYGLIALDNVVVPRGMTHRLNNSSQVAPAVVHMAMRVTSSSYSKAMLPVASETMPDTATGIPGGERINRFETAARYETLPNVTFIDLFNQDLIPGIQMSGGYGLFQPGGRLPAHVHDFDESICIIGGTATCLVESRRYTMADCATALQPRGRVHYFVNNTTEPMAMLWVYAGPVPARIAVDERCATEPGVAWPAER